MNPTFNSNRSSILPWIATIVLVLLLVLVVVMLIQTSISLNQEYATATVIAASALEGNAQVTEVQAQYAAVATQSAQQIVDLEGMIATQNTILDSAADAIAADLATEAHEEVATVQAQAQATVSAAQVELARVVDSATQNALRLNESMATERAINMTVLDSVSADVEAESEVRIANAVETLAFDYNQLSALATANADRSSEELAQQTLQLATERAIDQAVVQSVLADIDAEANEKMQQALATAQTEYNQLAVLATTGANYSATQQAIQVAALATERAVDDALVQAVIADLQVEATEQLANNQSELENALATTSYNYASLSLLATQNAQNLADIYQIVAGAQPTAPAREVALAPTATATPPPANVTVTFTYEELASMATESAYQLSIIDQRVATQLAIDDVVLGSMLSELQFDSSNALATATAEYALLANLATQTALQFGNAEQSIATQNALDDAVMNARVADIQAESARALATASSSYESLSGTATQSAQLLAESDQRVATQQAVDAAVVDARVADLEAQATAQIAYAQTEVAYAFATSMNDYNALALTATQSAFQIAQLDESMATQRAIDTLAMNAALADVQAEADEVIAESNRLHEETVAQLKLELEIVSTQRDTLSLQVRTLNEALLEAQMTATSEAMLSDAEVAQLQQGLTDANAQLSLANSQIQTLSNDLQTLMMAATAQVERVNQMLASQPTVAPTLDTATATPVTPLSPLTPTATAVVVVEGITPTPVATPNTLSATNPIVLDVSNKPNTLDYQLFEGNYQAVTLATTMTWGTDASNDYCGLVFNVQNQANYYTVEIDRLGEVRVYGYVDAIWQAVDSSISSSVRTAPNDSNRLEITTQNGTAQVRVNDQIILEVDSLTFTQGQIGVMAGTFDGLGVAKCIFTETLLTGQ
ncbi:MAG: hypothetical protein ACOYLB_07695 [Phototrophicaceae bacterium]